MASISTVITDQLATYSIAITDTKLETLLVNSDLDGNAVYTKTDKKAVDTALLSAVTDILAMPDVTEGGIAYKWDRTAVLTWANSLRSDLGLSAPSSPKIRNLSNIW